MSLTTKHLLPLFGISCSLIVLLYFLLLRDFTFGPIHPPITNNDSQQHRHPSGSSISVTSSASTTISTPRILLVSALFPLTHAKHSQADYAKWLKRYLGTVTTDIYFFAPPSLESAVVAARISGAHLTLNTTFASAFSVPPLHGLEATYQQMYKKDRERFRHSPELYAVWNAKPYLTREAIRNMRLMYPDREYDYVFWNDAGSFREEHGFRTWPDPDRVVEVWQEGSRRSGTKVEDLMFFAAYNMPAYRMKYWKEHMGPIDVDFSEGSFFGGSPATMSWWAQTFYAYHDYYLSLSYFVGKDQSIFNSILLLYPERFITTYYRDVSFLDRGRYGTCGWGWWYYQLWFGTKEDRQYMRNLWLSGLSKGWVLWRGKLDCTITPLMTMMEIFQRRFGRGWTPPERHLQVGVSTN